MCRTTANRTAHAAEACALSVQGWPEPSATGRMPATVNLNVDLDIMLAVLAQALTAALRARLPGYAAATPEVIQRRFPKPPARSSPPATPSPSGSNAAPTHPFSARPACPKVPAYPGWATEPSTTSSADLAPIRLRGNPR